MPRANKRVRGCGVFVTADCRKLCARKFYHAVVPLVGSAVGEQVRCFV